MARKGIPKRDRSGGGVRKNKGRGGCKVPRKTGQQNRRAVPVQGVRG